MDLNSTGFWSRPYDSEQVIPTVEELVGVSELNIFVDGEEAGSRLAELFNWLGFLTDPISIEEESRGKLQASLKSLTDFDFVTMVPNPQDCELSNVLPTRAERLRSRLLPRTQLKRTYDHAGQWDGGGCTAQLQNPERSKVDSPSEVYSRQPGLLMPYLAAFRTILTSKGPSRTRRIWVPYYATLRFFPILQKVRTGHSSLIRFLYATQMWHLMPKLTLFLHRKCICLWNLSSHYHPLVCPRTPTQLVAWNLRRVLPLTGFTRRKLAGLNVTTGQRSLGWRVVRNNLCEGT